MMAVPIQYQFDSVKRQKEPRIQSKAHTEQDSTDIQEGSRAEDPALCDWLLDLDSGFSPVG